MNICLFLSKFAKKLETIITFLFTVMKHISFKLFTLGATALLAAQSFAADVTINVSPTETHQSVIGIGGGMVYYQNWVTAHKNKSAIYDTVFNGLGLSGLRMGNWAQEDNADLSNDAEIVKEGKKRLGSNFFIEMSSWSAPPSLKNNNDINGSNGGPKASLKKENGQFVYDKFGAWWKNSLQRYIEAGIIPDYISIQNEPDMDAQYEATIFDEKENGDVASYAKALEAVHKAMSGMEHCPKFLGPEPLGIGWNNTQKYINALDKNLLDGYCFHYYHSGDQSHDNDKYSYPDDYLPAMKALAADYPDKPQFMTENCSMREQRKNDALHTAWFLANAFNANRVGAYLHWNLIWGGSDGCVTVENPWETGNWKSSNGYIVQSEYHGLRHFSKFVRPGWFHIGSASTNGDIISCAFKSPENDAYTVVLINKGYSSHNATLSFPIATPDEGQIIQTVPSSETWSKVLGQYKEGEKITLPANSVTTISLKNNVAMPKFTWEYPIQADTYWERGTTQTVRCSVDMDLDYEVSLCWNPTAQIKEIDASSIWMNDEGTFGWEAKNALVEGDEGRWGAAGVENEWLELTLEEESEIAGAIIDETSGIGCNIKSYELQYDNAGEWTTLEKGSSIGENYTATFQPVVASKFRLFIKESGCININYFNVIPNKRELFRTKSSINYAWETPKEPGKGFFTIEKDGMVLSQSEKVSITEMPTALKDSYQQPQALLFIQKGMMNIYTQSARQATFQIWNAQGILIQQGNVSLESGWNSLPVVEKAQGLLFVQIGENRFKVIAE